MEQGQYCKYLDMFNGLLPEGSVRATGRSHHFKRREHSRQSSHSLDKVIDSWGKLDAEFPSPPFVRIMCLQLESELPRNDKSPPFICTFLSNVWWALCDVTEGHDSSIRCVAATSSLLNSLSTGTPCGCLVFAFKKRRGRLQTEGYIGRLN